MDTTELNRTELGLELKADWLHPRSFCPRMPGSSMSEMWVRVEMFLKNTPPPPAAIAGLGWIFPEGPLTPTSSSASYLSFPSPGHPITPPAGPQVDDLMRQELKNLRLAVDREETRPMKPPKARRGARAGTRQGTRAGEARNRRPLPVCLLSTRRRRARNLGRRRKKT